MVLVTVVVAAPEVPLEEVLVITTLAAPELKLVIIWRMALSAEPVIELPFEYVKFILPGTSEVTLDEIVELLLTE